MVLNHVRDSNFNKKTPKNNIIYLTICFLYGTIALSGWSYYILIDLIGLPFYAYEVFFIPVVLICRKFIFAKLKRIKSSYLLAFFGLMLFFFIGLIRHPEHMASHITTFRTLIYIFVFMYFFSSAGTFAITQLQFLCFGATIGQFVYMLSVESEADQTSLNIIALSFMIIIPIVKKRVRLSEIMFFSIVGLIVSFRSSFRINIVVVLISLVLAIMYSVFVQKRRTLCLYLRRSLILG